MKTPWGEIPWTDYENHRKSDSVMRRQENRAVPRGVEPQAQVWLHQFSLFILSGTACHRLIMGNVYMQVFRSGAPVMGHSHKGQNKISQARSCRPYPTDLFLIGLFPLPADILS